MIAQDRKSVRVVTEFNWFSLEIIWEFDSFVYTFASLSFTFFSIRLSPSEKIPRKYIVCINWIRKRSVLFSKKEKKRKKQSHAR